MVPEAESQSRVAGILMLELVAPPQLIDPAVINGKIEAIGKIAAELSGNVGISLLGPLVEIKIGIGPLDAVKR